MPPAIADGFKVVVSSFLPISSNNALNNGILPGGERAVLSSLFASVQRPQGHLVDLEAVHPQQRDRRAESFEINPYKKECLLKGLDDIDLSSNRDKIEAYEKSRPFVY